MPRGLWLLAIPLAFWGCDASSVFEANYEIEDGIWDVNDAARFSFQINDTVNFHDFHVHLRNGDDYAWNNIYLFVDLTFPNGKHSLDTVECILADPQGKWYGSGAGSRYYNRFRMPSKTRVVFPDTGTYHVSIQQAMRDSSLEGIHDVGFRLSLSN